MRRINQLAIFFLPVFCAGLFCPYTYGQPQAKHGLHYETPATVWDEALPLGNGLLGALVWGDEKPLPDNIRFAHTGPVFFDDPSLPLLPDRRQIEWVADSVMDQINCTKGKLSEKAMAEYEQALEVYQAVAKKLPATFSRSAHGP
jgi:hypothetical protein